MTTIYKYAVPVQDMFHLDLPRGAQCLHVDMQRGEPQLWALVEPANPRVRRQFTLVGTGHPAPTPDEAEYVGTFQMTNGLLVFHLFADPETSDA